MIWGNKVRLTIFGESHGPAIGAVLEGLPAGEEIDFDEISMQMARRAPGRDASSTPRKEADTPKILSGMLQNRTTGAPLCAVIENTNTRSSDYENLRNVPRPGHADYTAHVRYGGFQDVRGGGHFSGRLTAPLVFAGAVCRQILRRRSITIGAHVLSVHGVFDFAFDPANISPSLLDDLSSRYFPTIRPEAETAMRAVIEDARRNQDSVGGVIECAVSGIPAGVGGPLSDGVESVFFLHFVRYPRMQRGGIRCRFFCRYSIRQSKQRPVPVRPILNRADENEQRRRNSWRNHDRDADCIPRSVQAHTIHWNPPAKHQSENGKIGRTHCKRTARPVHCAAGGSCGRGCSGTGRYEPFAVIGLPL
jgi:hypothetical protein